MPISSDFRDLRVCEYCHRSFVFKGYEEKRGMANSCYYCLPGINDLKGDELIRVLCKALIQLKQEIRGSEDF